MPKGIGKIQLYTWFNSSPWPKVNTFFLLLLHDCCKPLIKSTKQNFSSNVGQKKKNTKSELFDIPLHDTRECKTHSTPSLQPSAAANAATGSMNATSFQLNKEQKNIAIHVRALRSVSAYVFLLSSRLIGHHSISVAALIHDINVNKSITGQCNYPFPISTEKKNIQLELKAVRVRINWFCCRPS